MLKIKKTVLEEIQNRFLSNANVEQGFLLGSEKNLEQVDMCGSIPVKQTSTYFIVPDAKQVDEMIDNWAKRKICFCGMIHSHVRQKEELSDADILFAKQLYRAYQLPFLWFGIGVVKHDKLEFEFYRLRQTDCHVLIEAAEYIGV